VGRASTFDVARPDNKIGLLDRLQKGGEIAWVVRKICIHLKSHIIAMLDSEFKSRDIGCAKTKLTLAMYNADLCIRRRQLIGKLARTVGGVVVNDEQVGIGREGKYLLLQRT